ncbi:hypothetical protein EHS17_15295 [Rhodobacteraceae bacterium CH30]|nr:hypothetical protein EHS17_15280 [Rhodobacteraceae bacterium CH30]RQW19578.1 hypothetical protein EHS17_15295 [Rhodobacteraceae bacterium CH30]
MAASTKEQGQENRESALRSCARLGYMTIRQFAMIQWRRCDKSAMRMAARTLQRLADDKLIVRRRDGDSITSEQLCALSAAGAGWVRENIEALPCDKKHGRDWIRHAHPHRTACNDAYAALRKRLAPGSGLVTELEVRSGELETPIISFTEDHKTVTKIPDLLLTTREGVVWIEVEHSRRNDKDLERIIFAMRKMFSTESGVITVVFIVTRPVARKIGERLRKKLTHNYADALPRQVKELDAKILSKLTVFELNPETLELTSIPV